MLPTLPSQELAEKARCRPPIAARLNHDVEHVTVLVDGTPHIVAPSLFRHKELVQIPRVTQPTALGPKPPGVERTEPLTPLPNRLVGDDDASLGQQVLNIPAAESEQPDGVTDCLRRKSIAAMAGRMTGHPPTLPASRST